MPSSVRISKANGVLFAQDDAEGMNVIKLGKRFYRPSPEAFLEIRRQSNVQSEETISDSALPLAVMAVLVLVGLLVPLAFPDTLRTVPSLLLLTLFLVVNLLLHELAHALTLKAFYPEATVRAGFKLTFVFPTFYVDTSDSYLLPTRKRLAVYLAGNAANGLLATLALLAVPELAGCATFVSATMAINLLPIMKSDGYHVVETLRGHYSRHKSSRANFAEDLARGAIAFCVLYLISALARAVL